MAILLERPDARGVPKQGHENSIVWREASYSPTTHVMLTPGTRIGGYDVVGSLGE
jgi:hypothetical protein